MASHRDKSRQDDDGDGPRSAAAGALAAALDPALLVLMDGLAGTMFCALCTPSSRGTPIIR